MNKLEEGFSNGWFEYQEQLFTEIHEIHLKWERKIQETDDNMLASDRENMRLEIWTCLDDIRNGRLV